MWNILRTTADSPKLQNKFVEWRDFLGVEATCLNGFTTAVNCQLNRNTSPATVHRNARLTGVVMQNVLRNHLGKCDQRNEAHDSGADIRANTVAAFKAWKGEGPAGNLVHNLGWDKETSDALFAGLLEGFSKPVDEQDPIEGVTEIRY